MMIPGIRGKRAIVTASSKGIGFSIAEKLLSQGMEVFITSHDENNLNRALQLLQGKGKVHGQRTDLRIASDVVDLVAKAVDIMGGLEVAVYVTGSPPPGDIMTLDDKQWEESYRLLIQSAVIFVRESAKRMRKGGRIILSTSMTLKEPLPNLDLSNVLRGSLAGLIRSSARNLGRRGITVNGVMPGWIYTDRLRQLVENRAASSGLSVDQVRADIVKDIPLGRFGEPSEVANVVLFLASDLASYVNGAVIPVDGGLLKSVL